MRKRARSGTDTGAVLVFVLLLMLALVGLGHGLLVSALAELAASSAGARHLAARAAAEAAVARALRGSRGPWMDSTGVGETHASGALSLGRASGSATLTRLTRESWIVQGRGTGPAGGETRTASLAWALDPLERITVLSAAVSGRAGALWDIDGEVDPGAPARVEPPLDAADCAPWLGDLEARYADSPLASVGVATDTVTIGGPALGLLDFASLLASAEVGVAGSGTPAPVERLGECAIDEPWAWGDPDQPTRPCGPHLPLRSADGDVAVEGGAGQGVLVVDGDLTFASGARYYGLVLVSGTLRLEGASTLEGMALAWDGAIVGVGSRIVASACWGARALAAQRAVLGRLKAVPGVGPLGPL